MLREWWNKGMEVGQLKNVQRDFRVRSVGARLVGETMASQDDQWIIRMTRISNEKL